MSKLPKHPTKGSVHKVYNPKTKRSVCFKATGKKGFGKWRITKCSEKSINPLAPQGDNFHASVGWY